MTTYHKLLEKLEPLETFDPRVFEGDDRFPQEVCDIVVTLALIYNDFRDLIVAHQMLSDVAPADPLSATPARGMYSGLVAHVFRLTAGLLRELQVFIEENIEIIEGDVFRRFIKQLPKAARDAWESVVAATGKKPKDDELTSFRSLRGIK